MKFRNVIFSCAAIVAVLIPAAIVADAQGRHPAYMRARSDLRASQYLMRVREEPNVTRNMEAADREVEAAIREIDRAAVLDRRDIEDRPPADVRIDRRGRFGRIVSLLRSARADLAREEENGRARGWRDEAFRHIDGALEHVHRAAVDLHWDRELGF